MFTLATYSFPEMLPIQVSKLVTKINEEAEWLAEGATRKRLREKIASLTLPEVTRAADALSMIWSYSNGPLDSLVTEAKSTVPIMFTFFPNWPHVKLAFLKSIITGVFLDAQFYAFNKICNNTPFDPKPLFISSIVIEEWSPAIMMRKWENPPIVFPP
jgi:hypothetical protein